jgi:hypothetical protein
LDLYQFKALDEHKQYDVLWDEGVFIIHRKEAGYTLALYQIDAFYVEVSYDGATNKILSLRSFLNTNRLEPYLKNMQLPSFD